MQLDFSGLGWGEAEARQLAEEQRRKEEEAARRAEEERKKLAGIGHNGGPPLDHETLFVEYTIDKEDDWKSEVALRKANPNADVSVSMDFLRARQRDAISTPRKAGVFKTKHLNLWVSTKAAYYSVEHWRACAGAVPSRLLVARLNANEGPLDFGSGGGSNGVGFRVRKASTLRVGSM